MGRTRGRRTMVVNKSSKSGIGIDGRYIHPNQVAELSVEEMENPGVVRMIQQGMLAKIPMPNMVRRLVDTHPRILVIVHTLFRGGAEVSTIELHRRLGMMGCNQMLLNIYVGDNYFHTMLADEAREVFDVYEEHNVADKDEKKKIILGAYGKYKPDIVLYSLLREVPQLFMQIPNSPPVIQVMHSELGDSQWGYDPVGTDAVITVSNAMAVSMGEKLKIPQEKRHTIWNGIDPDRIIDSGESLRKELKIPAGSVVVGMVGNMNELKRPMVGLEAFLGIRRKTDYMIFAGNPDGEANTVRARIEELGLEKYVRVLGLRDDIENVYATIDILINCSTMEGLPMTLIEGMFASLPVIATAVGGNPEVIEEGVTGYTYPVNKDTTLSKHLLALLRNKKLRTKMGNAGHLRAQQNFHVKHTGQQYYDFLRTYTINPEQLRCSVVMPVYNGERWLDRAIWSVRSQTMPYFEFIIVDDGSTDKSRQIIQKHIESDKRIKLINVKHGGIVPALNTGITASKTPLIVRMDADDEMVATRLQMQLEYMDSNHHIDVLGTQMFGRSADGRDMGPMHALATSHEAICERMKSENPMSHPTVAFRKQAWQQVGGYKGDGRCEDYRLWVEMRLAGCQFANLSEPLLIYQHTHEGNATYATWRDSILSEIKSRLHEGLVAASG